MTGTGGATGDTGPDAVVGPGSRLGAEPVVTARTADAGSTIATGNAHPGGHSPDGQDTPVVAVVGPTGTGKSDLAVDLALALDGEVINADALQLYRGMDIGTAKLPVDERRGVPHHVLDVLDVTEEASLAAYQRRARAVIDDVLARGRRPVLVGGSGLYVRAALDHLELPGTDPAVRARLEAEADAGALDALRTRLARVDPVSAGRLHDARRVVRALEVHEITGRPFASFMPERRYLRPTVQVGLRLGTPALRERLTARVGAMTAAGLADEVARLDAAGLRRGRTASRAIGYAQFLAVRDGTMSEAEAIASTATATHRFAKRQRTWFGADPRIHWIDVEDRTRDDLRDAALALLAVTPTPPARH